MFWRSLEYAEEYTDWEWRSLFRRKVYDELVWAFTTPYLPKEKSLVLDAGGGSGEVLDLLLDLEKFVRERPEATPYSRRMYFAAKK